MRISRTRLSGRWFTSSGLDRQGPDGVQTRSLHGEQSEPDKVGGGPALMVDATATSLALPTPAQDASQPHPDPAIQAWKRGPVALLEVAEPATGPRFQAWMAGSGCGCEAS